MFPHCLGQLWCSVGCVPCLCNLWLASDASNSPARPKEENAPQQGWGCGYRCWRQAEVLPEAAGGWNRGGSECVNPASAATCRQDGGVVLARLLSPGSSGLLGAVCVCALCLRTVALAKRWCLFWCYNYHQYTALHKHRELYDSFWKKKKLKNKYLCFLQMCFGKVLLDFFDFLIA